MRKRRSALLFASTVGYYVVFGGICTAAVFRLLPSPWDWIVALLWLAFVLPQPIAYFHFGNGRQMDERYIQTGKYNPGEWEN